MNFYGGLRIRLKELKVMKELSLGGLNMIDIKCLFRSFKAVWITRILNSDPSIHSWSQLAYFYYKPFMDSNENLMFNIDDKVDFPDLKYLSPFYKEVLTAFNKAFVTDLEGFK